MTKTTTNPSNRRDLCALLSSIGLLLIALSMLVPVLKGAFDQALWYRYVYTAGAAICVAASLFNPTDGLDTRSRRWQRIESWSSILFATGAAFMFIPNQSPRDWVAFTLAAAALRLICFFRSMFSRKKSTQNTKE